MSTVTPSIREQRLLIIDDDDMFCHVLGRALTRRGYDISIAHDADQALTLAATEMPTMATLDLKLENSSGLKLLPELLTLSPQCRVVVLTGYSSIATAVEAIKLGAVNYLCKPADADDVLNAFESDELGVGTAVSSNECDGLERLRAWADCTVELSP